MIYPIISANEGSNCFILSDEKTVLVDSGIDPIRILMEIKNLGMELDFIIGTHCHYDHIAGISRIKEETGAKLLMHKIDAQSVESNDSDKTLSSLFFSDFKGVEVDIKLRDKQKISLGRTEIEVIHTPGHTPGSICLYEEESKSLFSGDTIFSYGVGRTDFSGGNWSELKKSIEKLIKLHKKRGIDKLYPGHGPIGNGEEIEETYRIYF
ncbi:MAG TPA: MBL fold metallo-hydrolase [Candidatus Altiarchaeales archaeon]|nr:MBL fold metallo-hydrolase [Candidatus Altiarchaeales archaeon]